MVPYVVVAVIVMRVLLFVLDVSMLRECEVDGNACVVTVSAGHAYVGGTRGSDIVSIVAGVLWMSVVREMREVGGVCEMCMFLLGVVKEVRW